MGPRPDFAECFSKFGSLVLSGAGPANRSTARGSVRPSVWIRQHGHECPANDAVDRSENSGRRDLQYTADGGGHELSPFPVKSLSRGVVQDHPLGFAIELPAHGFGSFVDETLQPVRRTIDPVRSLSWRRRHRLHADRLLELVQEKSGFSSDGVVNDRGDFIDAPVQSVRHEQPREKIFQVRAINAPELIDRHDPFNESVIPGPRMPDARTLKFSQRSEPEIAPRGVQVPRDESKLVRPWIEIQVEVLAVCQNAVVVRKQNFN